MRAYDIISNTKHKIELSDEQIKFLINGFVDGSIKDYQMTAWLMAVCLNGLTEHETAVLTDQMARSGDMIDLSAIHGTTVDKHSTGGVGDKTTFICIPIVAACGVPVAKMSGRGLGHTGGTIDKLESIPGYRFELTKQEFFDNVNEIGLSVIGQTGNIAPADKMIYALRDVTATVDALPLIASSIMSKKLASGSRAILLDVKTGSGAVMKTLEESIELAKSMVSIGERNGRHMAALVTNMDIPLGRAVGNALEVAEAVYTLRNEGAEDLLELCIELSANMLMLADKGTLEECRAQAKAVVDSGAALEKLRLMVEKQGGDVRVIEDPKNFGVSDVVYDVVAQESGYISMMNTENIGIASVVLGAGRETKEDVIDYKAGIMIERKTGDFVGKGDVLARLHTSKQSLADSAERLVHEAYTISDTKPGAFKLVEARVTKDQVERF